MAVSDYSPLGLAKRFFTPQQDYGWNMQTTTSKPLINFNNSGFNPPMAGGQTIKPTAGVQGRNASPVSLAKPATVVAPAPVAAAKPVVGKSKSGGGSKGDKALKAPISNASLPPLVPASTAAVVAPEVMGVGIAEPQLAAYGNELPSLANPATVEGNIWMNPDQTDANAALAKFGTENPAGTNWDMGDIAKGVEAASGLANAYLGYKNYGLAKDQFGFTKALANRNIANQASEYNTGLQNAGEVGMSLAGNTMDPAARAARQSQLTGQKISGAPIG